jgi:hypothetical protein
MKAKNRTRALWAVALTAVVWACDDWSLWDDMFKRTGVQSSPRGWTGGDGAVSALLPNGRVFWIFGDSYLTSWDALARRTELRDPLDPGLLNDVVFGNTIAVQEDKADPDPDRIRFHARQAPGHIDFHGSLLLMPSEDITEGRSASAGYTQFFNHVMMKRPPPSPDGKITILWPAGAECLDCGTPSSARLLLGLTEVQFCDPTVHSPCLELCEALGIEEHPCKRGVHLSGSIVARIKGIDQSPDAWSVDFTTSSPDVAWLPNTTVQGVDWGKAFIAEGSYIYIYGVKRAASLEEPPDLVLARAPKADVMKLSSWRYLNPSNNWVTSSSSLKVVAPDVGSMVSVDRITPTGKDPKYVLTHGDAGHQMFLRTSSSRSSWASASKSTPRLDLVSIDSSAGWQILDLMNREQDPACLSVPSGSDLSAYDHCRCIVQRTTAGVSDYRHCGLVYHGMGHHHLSASDGSRLLSSYVVPWGPNPWYDPVAGPSPSNPATGGQDTRYYRPKFANLDLTKLKPWCTTTNNCWEGVVKQYPQRALGATSYTYNYDISQSSRFYAQLTRLTGSAAMKVEHRGNNGSPLIRTDTCTVSSSTVTCNVAKASGATVARVVVTGVATDTYILQTHYAGWF